MVLGGLAFLPLATETEARVGESIREIESRLTTQRTGLRYPDHRVEALIQHRSVPYRGLLEFFPEQVEHHLFYKPAEDRRASNRDIEEQNFPEGWHLHVVTLRDNSIFEAYRRLGAPLTDAEVEGLLLMHRGTSKWVRVSSNERGDSAFDYQFEREDEKLRARRWGSALLFFRPEFDENVFATRQEYREERRLEQEEMAPESLHGF